MQKLSLLTFTRNDVDNIFGMIEDLYDTVDDIVVMECGDKEYREKLHAMKKKKKWDKVKIYYLVPLGFMELPRPYGLSKCKNDWVLFLCADERTSDQLKLDVISIINNTKCVAFNTNRYENVNEGEGKSSFFTYQIQLLRKSKVKYKGIVDERPTVDGMTCMLDSSKYYIRHITQLMHHDTNEYYKRMNKFSEFEGISYQEYNDKIQEYFSRFRGKDLEKVKKTLSTRTIYRIMIAYEKITLKKPDQELSNFDYFFFIMMRVLVGSIQSKSIRGVFVSVPNAYKRTRDIAGLKRQLDHETTFKISRIINKIGMVGFLELDKEEVVKKVNKEYKDNKQDLKGLALLSLLLKQKYAKTVASSNSQAQ